MQKGCSIVCQRCGRCCAELLEAQASIEDIATWIAAKRFDILKWVDPIIGPSSEVIAFDIWIGPKTHDDVKKCPWLRKNRDSNLFECAIYDVRPAACREWPINIAGAQQIGCLACQEKLSGNARKEIKVVKLSRDGD
jgi:Fe-S-cluster containining protein